ncbi:hypothetical protein KO361_02440 [Candidatus Woesearchaeota archaeon]|nr:hypothetical protein [Candidatus Woesearchaeota archaeon]
MAKKKDEKPEHMKHVDTYMKHADAIDVFSDNLHLKIMNATSKTLLKEGSSWVKDGEYDRKAIAKGGKVIDDLTDAMLNDLIAASSPQFKKMYNIDLPKLGDDPASKHFYEKFLGINKKNVREFVDKNKKNWSPEVHHDFTSDYAKNWVNELSSYAHSHIDAEKHLDDYIKEYKLKDIIDDKMLPAFKKSNEASLLIRGMLDYYRKEGKNPDAGVVQNLANAYKQESKGKIDITKYLK